MRRFDATPRRATPKGHESFISCTATRQESRLPKYNAGKAGTSSTSRSSTRTRPPRSSGGGSRPAPTPRPSATRPPATGRTRATWTSSSPNWTTEITSAGMRGNVLPARPTRRHRSTRRRQDAPDLPRRKVASRTVGQDLHRAGRQDVPAVDVPHPDLPQLRAGPRRRHPGRPRLPTTTPGRRGTRCISRRCSTGSSRTCAGSSAMTCSTSPPSNRSGASPRTSTSRCAAPSPAPSCAGCWPRPTTRCGGRTPPPSGSTATSCPSGTSTACYYLDPVHRGSPAHLGPGPRRHRRTRTSRCTWPGSGTGSTPRACWPGPRTRPGASGT